MCSGFASCPVRCARGALVDKMADEIAIDVNFDGDSRFMVSIPFDVIHKLLQ